MSALSNVIKDVTASPLGEVIAAVGRGVAEAQQALDEASLAKVLEIYSEGSSQALQLLREIGYSPTFYALPETTGEVRVSMSLGNGQTTAAPTSVPAVDAAVSRFGLAIPGLKNKIYATPVDAGYANRYGYRANIGARLTFKIVPVPAPSGVEELRTMPNLVGEKAGVARQRLETLELAAAFFNAQGSKIAELDDQTKELVVSAQEPPSSTIVRAGANVVLRLG